MKQETMKQETVNARTSAQRISERESGKKLLCGSQVLGRAVTEQETVNARTSAQRISERESGKKLLCGGSGTWEGSYGTGIGGMMRKYLRLMGVFMKFSLMSQMEYRINFLAGVIVEMGWMLVKLLYVAVVYRVGIHIGVLSPDHIMLFIGIYVLMTGFYMLYYSNFTNLSQMVREGEMDMYLVKPVSLQFLVTLRHWSFPMFLPNAVAGSFLIVTGWTRAGLTVSVGKVAGFLFLLLCSNLLTYSLFLIPNLLSFWIMSTGGLANITAAMWDFNNMPKMIYGKWMQRVGTFILPVFVITNFPGLFVMGELSPFLFFWAVLSPLLFFLLARVMWKKAVKNYSSASS